MRELFESQRRSLDHFFDQIEIEAVHQVFERLLACKGLVLCTGVGKSGHIAQKVAATFASTGTRSLFLSPAGALHGDIGLVSQGDVCLLLSKSGETQELVDLVPHLQSKGVYTIACVSVIASRLAKSADFSILLPVRRELCPFDLAPTVSTTVQLIFGDCLAMGLMNNRGFSQSDFRANHPAGFLGKRLTLKVADLMLKEKAIPLCSPEKKLLDLLHELSGKRCGCLIVVDPDGRLAGIFTDGDLRRAIETKGSEALQQKVGDVMTKNPKTTGRDKLAFEAMRQMEENPEQPVTVLPVLDGGKVIGLLRMHDILQAGLH